MQFPTCDWIIKPDKRDKNIWISKKQYKSSQIPVIPGSSVCERYFLHMNGDLSERCLSQCIKPRDFTNKTEKKQKKEGKNICGPWDPTARPSKCLSGSDTTWFPGKFDHSFGEVSSASTKTIATHTERGLRRGYLINNVANPRRIKTTNTGRKRSAQAPVFYRSWPPSSLL